jgi:hypothetical protein
MAASADESQHETLPERGRSAPVVFSFLAGANRGAVAAFFVLFVPAAVLLGAFFHPSPFEYALADRSSIQGLYQALVISTVTGASLVLTIVQIVLSEEFGPVGDQRRRIEEAVRFQREVETLVPDGGELPTPASLLESVMGALETRAGYLKEAVEDVEDPELAALVGVYLEALRRDARLTASRLEPAEFGTFRALEAVFSFDVSAVLHETRRLRSKMKITQAQLGPAFDDIEACLQVFASARAHVKALYFQYELAELSRWIIYVSFPAIVVAVGSLIFFDPAAIGGGWEALTVATLTISVALSPFAVLLAYVLRLVEVTQSTFSRSPFLVRE